MRQIFNNLWLGDYDDLEKCSNKKGWIVIYVGYDSRFEREGKNVIYYKLIDDAIKQGEVINNAVSYLERYGSNYKNILVCCDAGLSRSPYIVARLISQRLGCNMDTAYKMLKAVYPQADENTPLRINDEVVE